MISWINPNLGIYQNWVFEIVRDGGNSLFWIASKRENKKLIPIEGDLVADEGAAQSFLQTWLVDRLREESDGKNC